MTAKLEPAEILSTSDPIRDKCRQMLARALENSGMN